MKRIAIWSAALALTITTSFGQVMSLSDIDVWVGTGINEAALIIDFQDGGTASSVQESFVWGYRWDGVATGFDMLSAIAAADANLTVSSPGFVLDISFFIDGSFYEGLSDFPNNISWGYYIAGGTSVIFDSVFPFGPIGTFNAPNGGSSMPTSSPTNQWSLSTSGTSDRTLADGSWDAFVFGTTDASFVHQTPPSNTVYAAPEPSSVTLFLLGGAALYWLRGRRS